MTQSGIFRHRTTLDNLPQFMGGGSKPAGNTTTTQTSEPWSGLQGPLLNLYNSAGNLYAGTPPQYYPSSTYQPMTGNQNYLAGLLQSFGASGGSPTLQAANGFSSNVLSPGGGYTNQTQGAFDQSNPLIGALGGGAALAATTPTFAQSQGYLSHLLSGATLNPATDPGFQNVVNTTLANTMPGITSSFTGAGRSDSGLAARAASEGATDAIGNLTYQNYLAQQQLQAQAAQQAAANQATALGTTEAAQGLASNNLLTQQGNQIKTAAIAPSIDQAELSSLGAGLSAAGMSQQDLQNQLNASINRFNYNQMLPWNTAGMYSSLINSAGNPGGTTTLQQPYYSNAGAGALSGALGGGALGASLLPTLFPSVFSAGGGAGVGAGLGLLANFL